jgi:hypothetical protein
MPTLHSHTSRTLSGPAVPANAQTKAWQRVCLSQRSTKTTDKQADEKEAGKTMETLIKLKNKNDFANSFIDSL